MYTAFTVSTPIAVRRFSARHAGYIAVPAFLALVAYTYYMGGVDRVDRQVALQDIRMNRVGVRYHRAIFWWMLSVVCNNVLRIFKVLHPEWKSDPKCKVRGLSFDVAWRILLADQLIKEGVAKWLHDHPDEEPHFVPKQPGPRTHRTPPLMSFHKRVCQQVKASTLYGFATNGDCAQCASNTVRDANVRHGRRKPDDHLSTPKGPVRQTTFCCTGCRVDLCKAPTHSCWTTWQHGDCCPGDTSPDSVPVYVTQFGQTTIRKATPADAAGDDSDGSS
jgi:hypothetical protein